MKKIKVHFETKAERKMLNKKGVCKNNCQKCKHEKICECSCDC